MIEIFPDWAAAIGDGLISLLLVGIIIHALIAALTDHLLS